METHTRNIRLEKLIEREKELNCLYTVENLLVDDTRKIEDVLQELVNAIPQGWQYSTVCECRIVLEGKEYCSPDFRETEYIHSANIVLDEHVAGRIDIVYLQLIRLHHGSAFLSEEQKLLNTIATSIGKSIFRKQLKSTLGYIKNSREDNGQAYDNEMIINPDSDEHWKWRYEIVKKIAIRLDLERFGLKGLYLIGSTKNANAGPGSDIDLLAHSDGDTERNEDFRNWIEGWGMCLDEMNYWKTGYHSLDSLIDLHIVTDNDIRKRNSYAIMINALTDRAYPIKLID